MVKRPFYITAMNAAMHALPFAAVTLFVGSFGAAVFAAKKEAHEYAQFIKETRSVNVTAPETAPHLNQRSVDVAVEIFSIDVPENVSGPSLDVTLYDRGLTTGDSLGNKKTVTIGPAAFSSWGILGSTLGHEIEVHAKQSFFKIVLLDKLSKIKMASKKFLSNTAFAKDAKPQESSAELNDDGTWSAEREAYGFELEHAERFQLTESEMNSIEQVLNTYYPIRIQSK